MSLFLSVDFLPFELSCSTLLAFGRAFTRKSGLGGPCGYIKKDMFFIFSNSNVNYTNNGFVIRITWKFRCIFSFDSNCWNANGFVLTVCECFPSLVNIRECLSTRNSQIYRCSSWQS
jgi:hypothetical protein